jgi:2-oxoisovalerate dehydrogenase E1 component
MNPGSLDDPQFARYLLDMLLRTRAVEERSVKQARQGLQPKFFSAWGNEATSVGTAAAMGPDDVLVPMHRSLGAHLVRGHSVFDIFLQAFLKDGAHTRGRDTGLHLGAPGTNIVSMISPLGSMNVVAAGIGLAEKLLGTDTVVMTYIGDGGTSTGVFHEAMNFIGVRKLPVVTVIENNQWAYGTPNDHEFGCETLAQRGPAYGMPGLRIDGTDLAEVYRASKDAVERARRGEGPTLIESVTMRMRGHAEHDDARYVPKTMIEEWAKKDPVDRFLAFMGERGFLDGVDVGALRARIDEEVLAEADRAREADEPPLESARVGVFFGDGGERVQPENGSTVARVPAEPLVRERAARHAAAVRGAMGAIPEPGAEVTYIDAIRACMHWRMRQDPRIVAIGEDIARMGGAFGATQGLLDEFGDLRVVDTPISENAILGACMGLALRGLRGVAEMQFSDFVASGFNELVNNAGTFRYRSGQGVPFVLRLPGGGGVGAGPFHSLNPESWFAHTPGLKIVAPSTVEDAWGLMGSALDDPDPVLFLEMKYYYRRLKAKLPPREFRTPIGVARMVRDGRDATVVAWGVALERAQEAAGRLAQEGAADIEVIDLRSIVPWDREAIARSVRKTGRLLVVHEARRTCGFGAEIAAFASDALFSWLDAPVRRLTTLDVPTPSHKALEAAVTPQTADVDRELRALLAF